MKWGKKYNGNKNKSRLLKSNKWFFSVHYHSLKKMKIFERNVIIDTSFDIEVEDTPKATRSKK